MWTPISCHLHLFASMLLLFHRLFQSTWYQCELQYLPIFIFLHQYLSYSIGSFNRPAINVNSNVLPSSFICLNAGPILWAPSVDLLSMRTWISGHLHLFAWMLVLFYGLFQYTCYQCELQYLAVFICVLECWSYNFGLFQSTCCQCELEYLPIFICLLECWPYYMGSFNRIVINVNANILASSFVCFNTFPILRPLSMDILSMWTSISSHLHLFPWMLVLFYGLLE